MSEPEQGHGHGHGHGHGPANRGRRMLETAAPLFVCEPTSATGRGAIVLHDVLGLTAEIEEACREIAATGRLTVAPYLYYEHGGPAFGADQLEAATGELRRRTLAGLAGDIRAALAYLAARGAPDVLVAGFGIGAYLAGLTGPTLIPPTITASGLMIFAHRPSWGYMSRKIRISEPADDNLR